MLSLVAGDSATKALADSPRFAKAFASLPSAEDSTVFFDMQAMLTPISEMVRTIAEVTGPDDVILNSTKQGPAHELNTQAWEAYEQQDYAQGLKLIEQAYELAPDDSRVLYYLACFHALLDTKTRPSASSSGRWMAGFVLPRTSLGIPTSTTSATASAMTLPWPRPGRRRKNRTPAGSDSSTG